MIADATQNIVTDLKSALGDLLREKINSFVSFGEVNFDESLQPATMYPQNSR